MNRARSVFAVGVLLSAALLARPLALQQSSDADRRYIVGVVRADGVLVPFAQFNAGLWRPIWQDPNSTNADSLPLTLDDVERDWWGRAGPSLQWTLWRAAGSSLPLNVSTSRVVASPCRAQAALGTDYKSEAPPPPPDLAPYPKIGIATTAPIDFEPIEQLSEKDAEWARVEAAVGDEFDDAESTSLEDMGWSHPTSRAMRKRSSIDLQSVWHVRGSRFFYFEAMRRYPDPKPPKGKPACDLVTYVKGYLWDSPREQLVPAGISALISYCHMERASFLWPLGVITERGKQYWVFQSAGWTSEVYSIVEPMPRRGTVTHHVHYMAGRCK